MMNLVLFDHQKYILDLISKIEEYQKEEQLRKEMFDLFNKIKRI